MYVIKQQNMKAAVLTLFILAPSYAFAAEAAALAMDFVDKINNAILFPLIALMMAVALLVFFYGAYEYVSGASNDGARETGRRHLLYGIIGFLVMLSAFAILNIAAGTFGLSDELDAARSGQTQNFNITP